VVLLANLIAMLFQSLSAKLGIVTGRNLAEVCRERYPRPVVWVLWVVSELAAMATDLAEFLGGAIGLSLLAGIPLLEGMAITAIVTYGILLFEGRGFRFMEMVIGSMVAIIGLCYLVELFLAPVDWGSTAVGLVTPSLPDQGALLIAVGIVGATVMPHAVFLHSGLTQYRTVAKDDRERSLLVRFSNREVVIALAVAGMVNMAMVIMAAAAFHLGHSEVAEIETAYHTLAPLLGAASASVFLVSLIASGVSSSVVGTMAGQMIMQGFVNFRIPGLAAPRDHHGARLHRGGDEHQRHRNAGDEPGRALDRPADPDDRAAPLHLEPPRHGRFRQQPENRRRLRGEHGDRAGPQLRPAGRRVRADDTGFLRPAAAVTACA
jgi:manganese transport protein